MRKIVIEGPRGSGKSTKAEAMKKKLEAEGKKVHISDEGDISTPAGLRAKGIDVVIITRIKA